MIDSKGIPGEETGLKKDKTNQSIQIIDRLELDVSDF